jgi:VanZ family protein
VIRVLRSATADRRLGWAGVWLLLLAVLTLFPFDFRREGPVFFWPNRMFGPEMVANVALFVPLGILVESGRRRAATAAVLKAAAAGLLVSLTVESLQAFLPMRDSSVVDLCSNTLGASVGAMGSWILGERSARWLARARARGSTVLAASLGVFTVLALATSAALQQQTRLSGWSPDYPLLVGNERTGERPWSGRIFRLDLSDAATPLPAVKRFAGGESVGLRGTPVASYRFTGSAPYRDATGQLPSFSWTEAYEAAPGDGVRLSGRPWLQSEQPAAALAQRLAATNAFTLRVECETDDPRQSGPARIVSNSLHTGLRNFTLGQAGADLVFRFRSPHNGFNGARPEFVVRGVFANPRRVEILVTYDGSRLLAAVFGTGRVYRADLTPGSSLALAAISLSIRDNELKMLEWVYLGALFLVPGALIGTFEPAGRRRAAVGVLWAVPFTVALEATLAAASGRTFDPGNVAVWGLVGILAVTTAAALSGSRPVHE